MSIDHASLQRVKAELGIQLPEEYEQLVQNIPPEQIMYSTKWLDRTYPAVLVIKMRAPSREPPG
jgi:hypothetical protein